MIYSLPVLTFHALDDRPLVISFSPRLFRLGISKLYEGGYRSLSLLEGADCIRRGKPFPERSFVITFDDGYQTVFDEAFPVLRRYNMTATVFLTVGEKSKSGHNDRLIALSFKEWCARVELSNDD